MHKILQRMGYTRCGVIRLGLFDEPALDERIAYQKCNLSEHPPC